MESTKIIIEKIYKDYNPDKVSSIPSLLEKYKGKENEMLSKILDKYSIRLQDYIKVDNLLLVTEILRKYEPVNISSASTLLSNNKNHEDELLKTLCDKYNAKLNDFIISLYCTTVQALNQKEEVQVQKPFIPESKTEKKVQKPKKSNTGLIIGISAVIVIAIVLILVFSGVFSTKKKSDNNRENQITNTNEAQPLKEEVELQAINNCTVSASSFLPPSGGLTYYPNNVIDNDIQTWWTPNAPSRDGQNAWIKLDFGSSKGIGGIEILNGSHYTNYPNYGDLYKKNNRLTKANIEFSDGNTISIDMNDIDAIQRITFNAHSTTYIKLYPSGWVKGSVWNDLSISHLKALEVSQK